MVLFLDFFFSDPSVCRQHQYNVQFPLLFICGKAILSSSYTLGVGCESVCTALHEIIHTLGFFHTCSRTDRDSYVIIYDKNIQKINCMVHNFHKYSHGKIDHLNSPYDITSIMHLP
ncbi:zinc metalloproteinase nas-4-like [Xenia sp. Carnegie-2017]|uniref:zinc metalloproteinase nas-4-like n=1 Tax=Xenia sp. Carnegie-2017 TaxID=2897299 RepID=UPI001F03CD75|nr:zinc metalloproteinase nas-4-like [Xenia sp. Carnegie-2017]